MKSFVDFLLECKENGTIFRILKYKRIFTPYEIERCYSDQTEFDSPFYKLIKIVDVTILPDCDLMIHCREYDEAGDNEDTGVTYFYKLSEIVLTAFDYDAEEHKEEEEDEYLL